MRKLLLLLIIPLCLVSCHKRFDKDAANECQMLPDTLRVGTLYSPTSYFLYRDEPMGYDYSTINQFASDKGLVLDLEVATSLQNLFELLDSGRVDVLAYEIPITAEYNRRVVYCGPENSTYQVLVQPTRQPKDSLITDVTQLIGRDVYVEADSKYYYRMLNLNREVGGGINIHTVNQDTLINENLIEMVVDGTIPLTVVDSDVAKLNRTYYRGFDASLPLSFPQKSAWGVAPMHQWLADSINQWFASDNQQKRNSALLKRYFEKSKTQTGSSIQLNLLSGHVSPYDALFKQYAKSIGYDWRMLAAQGWMESHYDSTLTSWAGAKGVMQIMPGTARAYGYTAEDMVNPEKSIAASIKIIQALDRSLSRKVSDPTERRKFILAAYNSGIAHILDAIALAQKYGKDPQIWTNNVEQALLMKSDPIYYQDPVCRAGYFHGRQTVRYVEDCTNLYDRICEKFPN